MNKDDLLKMCPSEIAKKPKLYKLYVLATLENDTVETLLQHGNGVWLSQLCHWAGIAESGTSKKKYERLIKWYNAQKSD